MTIEHMLGRPEQTDELKAEWLAVIGMSKLFTGADIDLDPCGRHVSSAAPVNA